MTRLTAWPAPSSCPRAWSTTPRWPATDEEAASATIAAVKQLSADVGIPADLKGILREEDIDFLSESAFADACCPGNPRDTSVEEIKALYRSLL